MKKLYVYRDSAVEYLFKDVDIEYSGYGDVGAASGDIDILILYMLPYTYAVESLLSAVDSFIERVKFISSSYPDKTIYAITLQNYFYQPFVISSNELSEKINEYNRLLRKTDNIRAIDISKFYTGHENVFDPKYYYLYNAIINPSLAKEFQGFLMNEIQILKQPRKKCLILDLDNTLWGGILGEDGASNLQISGSYPGNCFHDFQKMILDLKQQGVILALCSKNNYDCVKGCFESRDDLVLSLDDFVVKKINWEEKRHNVMEIAKELNIGLDSIVFIDDSPFERENVKTLSDVTVLDFPEHPYLMVEHFAKEFHRYFSIYNLTDDDMNKSKQYEYRAKSEELRAKIGNEDEFIKKLDIKITCEKLNQNNADRIAQLTLKSNQFNLTTRRYEKNDLMNMPDTLILAIKVTDKFGDLGITGVAIVKKKNKKAYIDSFLMSCRVLGRKIEQEFLKMVLNQIWESGIKEVIGEYIESPKNSQVADFYVNNGFTEIKSNDEVEQKRFKYILDGPLEYNNNYKVEIKNGQKN